MSEPASEAQPVTTMYRRLVPLDPALHRTRRIAPLHDYSVAAGMHAAFLTAAEFAKAALDFPIVFVEQPGGNSVLPVAMLGLVAGQNLHVDGARWTARYVPASVRRYPFSAASEPGTKGLKLLVDDAWPGFSETAGEPLFDEAGTPAPALRRAADFLERFERESARTRVVCERLVKLGLLAPMKADATLPGGRRLAVDGFQAVDEERLHRLPDATVLELWHAGALALVQLHLASLANIRHLVEKLAPPPALDAAPRPGANAATPATDEAAA